MTGPLTATLTRVAGAGGSPPSVRTCTVPASPTSMAMSASCPWYRVCLTWPVIAPAGSAPAREPPEAGAATGDSAICSGLMSTVTAPAAPASCAESRSSCQPSAVRTPAAPAGPAASTPGSRFAVPRKPAVHGSAGPEYTERGVPDCVMTPSRKTAT